MSHYKICVYAICKNEAQFVERWAKAVAPADLIVVCDTGSTDDTVEVLKQNGITPHTIQVSPWRFDEARNQCIDLIPEDMDICICMDLDEILEDNWRAKIENAWTEATTQLRYTFVWSLDQNGNPLKTFPSEKIHARLGYKWIYPVHEVLDYTGSKPAHVTNHYDLKIFHFPDLTKSRTQYLPLLEYSAKLFPKYDRNIHYLGREYLYHGKYNDCIKTLKYHLTLDTANWKDERCASMRYIAQAYKELGNTTEAKSWYYRAIAEAPYLREPYLDMVKLAYTLDDWPTVFHMVQEALRIQVRTGSYLDSPECWGFLFYDFGAISCFHLGLKDLCLTYSKKALDLAPDDVRLQNNYAIAKAHFGVE